MRVSANGIAFIQANEGFVGHVYNDNGKQAIGYGHDLQPGEAFPNGISDADAAQLLVIDLATRYEPVLNELVPADCTENQYDSLCDFAYNLGTGALRTMLAHGWDQVPAQMIRWDEVNGKHNPNIAARRAKEVQLFNS